MTTPLDGPKMVSQDLKDPIIAGWAQTKSMAVTLSRLTIGPAFMLESTFQVPMPKLCPLNGNFKLDLVKESLWVMIFGLLDSCCIALLKNLELL